MGGEKARAPGLLERLAAGPVLGDGGYLLELERRGYVQAGPFTPEVAIEAPEALLQLHLEFRRAGAEVLQALTFYGDEDKLASRGLASEAARINRAAVEVARQAAGDDGLVAGVVTLSPSFVPGDAAACRRVRTHLARQVDWLGEAGVDVLIGETFVHLEEALLALSVLRTTALPVMVTMNVGPSGSADGVDPGECARRLAGEGADVVGANCSYDPSVLLQVVAAMSQESGAHLACQPVGYRTADPAVPFTDLDGFPLALEDRQLSRFDMAAFALDASRMGVGYIGGCCGVGAHHVRAMAEALGRTVEASSKSPDLSRHVLASVRDRWADRLPSTGAAAGEPATKRP